jgi:hypothetical protein
MRQLDNCPPGAEDAAGQLVGLRDAHDLAHAVNDFDVPRIELPWNADGAQHRLRRARGAMDVESHRHQPVNYVLDLLFLRAFLHDYDHSNSHSLSTAR